MAQYVSVNGLDNLCSIFGKKRRLSFRPYFRPRAQPAYCLVDTRVEWLKSET
jgi:hypothetical protein